MGALEIYEPNDNSCVAAIFHSDTTVMSVARGDYINTGMFTMSELEGLLQVTSVEHIIWELEGKHQTQKVCVRTAKVGNFE